MPELRKDPVIGRWVIIATERAKRPSDFAKTRTEVKATFCPFCEGNEDKTPPEILAYRTVGSEINGKGWWIRVVPNKFPALRSEEPIVRTGEGMYDKMNGVGAHEVIIESPNHNLTFADFDLHQIEEVLWAYRDRYLDLSKDERFRYILIFKNHGAEAGASLDHTHSQIIALPVVPKRVKEELGGALAYYEYKERCVFCDMLTQETKDNLRVVDENASFISYLPFASRFPFETWVLPRVHESHFANIQKNGVVDLSRILKTTLLKLKLALDDPSYNIMLHTTPCRESKLMYYHWHLEIMPKLTKVAGFEWGTGFYINPTPPEDAAKFLKTVEANV